MKWNSHVLVWGDDGTGWANADRFNVLLANKDLRTKMLYELKGRQRGTLVLPHKKGMNHGRHRAKVRATQG